MFSLGVGYGQRPVTALGTSDGPIVRGAGQNLAVEEKEKAAATAPGVTGVPAGAPWQPGAIYPEALKLEGLRIPRYATAASSPE